MSVPAVSVMLCTYTEKRLAGTRDAIVSVQKQTLKPFEILLVIDNNPALYNQLVKEYAGQARVILSNKASGISAAHNTGVMEAKGDIIAFLDDDTIAEPEWLERLIKHYENDKVIGVMGESVLDWASGKPPCWFPWEFDWILGGSKHKQLVVKDHEVYTISDPNMSFRREVLIKAGLWRKGLGQQMGVRTNIRGGDIAEISSRIRQACPEGRFIYEPGAIMYHKLPEPRTHIGYFFHCAYLEGSTRAMVDRITRVNNQGKKTLQSHETYFRSLMLKYVPARLKKCYQPANAVQLVTIFVILGLMAAGFAREVMSRRLNKLFHSHR
jgi:glucosyl-dolichyl phosphate glucuronosyltransferase